MSRYTKEHYEDVARTIRLEREHWEGLPNDAQTAMAESILTHWSNSLADLFAADNPPTCIDCGRPEGRPYGECTTRKTLLKDEHRFMGGFNRKQFLAACGEPKH